jgi:transcriptional regulator with XRE-family HTH domain
VSLDVRKFGALIRKLREGRGLSQEQLAEAAGVHRTYVGKVERGEKEISLRTASKMAEALGIKLSGIISDLEGGRHNASH